MLWATTQTTVGNRSGHSCTAEGAEHAEARRNELTAEDWALEAQIRAEAPGILAKLIKAGPETLKRNPDIVPQDAHGLTAQYIGAWLWAEIDHLGLNK